MGSFLHATRRMLNVSMRAFTGVRLIPCSQSLATTFPSKAASSGHLSESGRQTERLCQAQGGSGKPPVPWPSAWVHLWSCVQMTSLNTVKLKSGVQLCTLICKMCETFLSFCVSKNVSLYKKQLFPMTAERTGLTPHIYAKLCMENIFLRL